MWGIDANGQSITDFNEISEKLKKYLGNKDIIQRRWDEVNTPKEIQEIVYRLRKQEKSILPWKKKRALKVAEKILVEYFKVTPQNQLIRKRLIDKLVNLFDENVENENMIDFNHFADLWLTILLPALDKKRQNRTPRSRKIFTIKDLRLKDIEITDEKLNWLHENCQYSDTLDELIASCIIAVKKPPVV